MAKSDVAKRQYIETRLEIADIENELDQLYQAVGDIRERGGEVLEMDQLPEMKQAEGLVEELRELRRRAISYEQVRSSGVAGLDPLIGEWGLKTTFYGDADGCIRGASLVSPSVQEVEWFLGRHEGDLVREPDDKDIFGDAMRNPVRSRDVSNLKLVGSYDLPAALELPDMSWIKRLDLSNTRLSAMDWVSLARCENLGQLETLDLSNTGTGYLGVLEILHSRNLPALKTLGLKRKPARKPKDPRLEKLASHNGPREALRTARLKRMAARVNRENVEFILRGPVK